MQDLMTEEEFQAFLASYGQERLFSLRVNPLKCTRERFAALFADLCPVPWEPDGFYYPGEFRPGRLPLHEAGMYYIQEASAMVPARLCGARPGERVLDLCAAPGGKSTKLAADLGGRGLLVANEIHPERARVLSANLERMGVRNALVTNASPRELASRFPLFFDRIVVDAPCSGEGMFRKEEEALQHWSTENVRMCSERQREILEEAASMLRQGGRLVYSTCTFAPEENEGTILHFLEAHPDFSVVRIQDLPGIEAEKWGFAPGITRTAFGKLPDSGESGEPADIFSSPVPGGDASHREKCLLSDLAGTIRLWPHRLEGEGHFAAVLKKEGVSAQRHFDMTDPGPADWREMPEINAPAGQFILDPEAADRREMPALFVPAEHSISENGKKDRKEKKQKKSGGKKNGGKKSGRMDPKEAELRQLWRGFREETLAPAAGAGTEGELPDLFGEDRLFCFGDMLYLLPISSMSLSLDGLRVLRAGLQLGSAGKGRFVPSHSLGMALRREEVLRSVDFPGQSEAAYAWFRGESVPLPAEAGFSKGWVLVCVDGCAAGWGKAAGAMIKNHYPKGLRKGSSYRPAR